MCTVYEISCVLGYEIDCVLGYKIDCALGYEIGCVLGYEIGCVLAVCSVVRLAVYCFRDWLCTVHGMDLVVAVYRVMNTAHICRMCFSHLP